MICFEILILYEGVLTTILVFKCNLSIVKLTLNINIKRTSVTINFSSWFIVINTKWRRNIYFSTDLKPYHPHSILSNNLVSGYDNSGRSIVTYYHYYSESITGVHIQETIPLSTQAQSWLPLTSSYAPLYMNLTVIRLVKFDWFLAA